MIGNITIQYNFIVCTLLGIAHGDGAGEQESLVGLQRTWLNVGHWLAAAEMLFEFTSSLLDKISMSTAENPCFGVGPAIACSPNPAYYVLTLLAITVYCISHVILTAARIVFQVVDEKYTIATLGEYQFLRVCYHLITLELLNFNAHD